MEIGGAGREGQWKLGGRGRGSMELREGGWGKEAGSHENWGEKAGGIGGAGQEGQWKLGRGANGPPSFQCCHTHT